MYYEGRICSLLRYRFLELHLAWYYLLLLALLLLLFIRSYFEQIRSGEIAGAAVPQKMGFLFVSSVAPSAEGRFGWDVRAHESQTSPYIYANLVALIWA